MEQKWRFTRDASIGKPYDAMIQSSLPSNTFFILQRLRTILTWASIAFRLSNKALQNSEKDNPDFLQRTFLSSELSLMSLIGNCMVTKSTGCHPGSFLFQIFYFPIVPCSDLTNALIKPVSRSLTNDYFSPDFALSFSPNSFI